MSGVEKKASKEEKKEEVKKADTSPKMESKKEERPSRRDSKRDKKEKKKDKEGTRSHQTLTRRPSQLTRRSGKEKKEKKKSKDPALKSSSSDATGAAKPIALTAPPAGKYELGKQIGGITLGCVLPPPSDRPPVHPSAI